MNTARKNWALLLPLLFAGAIVARSPAAAQGYSMDWWTIDNGAATSVGGSYTLVATIGQPDAGVLTGGAFELQGGFWNLDSPTAPPPLARPELAITRHDTVLRLTWRSPSAGFVLEETSDLTTHAWSEVNSAVSDDGTTRSVTVPATTGTRFYRLKQR